MSLVRFANRLLHFGSNPEEPEGAQYGAIPYQIVEDKVVFLMITSRRSANWVFPKGSLEKGERPSDTVARESFEEAGIRGTVGETPVGAYLHPRNNSTESLVKVYLYPFAVTEQLDIWPEEPQRFRHWALLPQVKQLMASRQASRIAADFSRRIQTGG